MGEMATIGSFIGMTTLLFMAISTTVLSYFVALQSPPSQRAGWTAGIGYLITIGILIFGGMAEGYETWVPVAVLPAALLAFWYWRLSFRRAWVNDPDLISEGESIEDDDWRIGLLRLLILAVVVIGAMLVRALFK